MRKRREEKVSFSEGELIDLRRFVNRAVACCEGRCFAGTSAAFYFARPLLRKIKEALDKIKSDKVADITERGTGA